MLVNIYIVIWVGKQYVGIIKCLQLFAGTIKRLQLLATTTTSLQQLTSKDNTTYATGLNNMSTANDHNQTGVQIADSNDGPKSMLTQV